MNAQMSADSMRYGMMRRTRDAGPRLMARAAGVLYLIAVLAAVFAEFVTSGKLGVVAAIVVPVACYAGVTVLLFAILRPVKAGVAVAALLSGLVALTFEALQLQPWGVNVGMTCHAVYCLLTGYLMFRSGFMPQVLGVLMAIAGLVWLIYLSPTLAKSLSPWNSAVGLLAEALPMLWLLVMGVDAQRWRHQARAAEV